MEPLPLTHVFERLTGQARRALVGAVHEAQANHDDYVGTEHVLLGLLEESQTGAGALFRLLSVDPERLQQQVRQMLQRLADEPDLERLPLTPGVRRTLAWAVVEADDARQAAIGPEFLLLGLSRDKDSLAYFLLAEAGVAVDAVRLLARLPPTENRDELVQAPARHRAVSRVDPTLAELEQLLDERDGPADVAFTRPYRRIGMINQYEVCQRQLANTQFLLALFMGVVVGATLGSWLMLLCMMAGGVVGIVRSSWLGGIAGAWAGIALAHHACPGQSIEALLLILTAILAGIVVGDWPARLIAGMHQEPPNQDTDP